MHTTLSVAHGIMADLLLHESRQQKLRVPQDEEVLRYSPGEEEDSDSSSSDDDLGASCCPVTMVTFCLLLLDICAVYVYCTFYCTCVCMSMYV